MQVLDEEELGKGKVQAPTEEPPMEEIEERRPLAGRKGKRGVTDGGLSVGPVEPKVMCFKTASYGSHSGKRGTKVVPVGPMKGEQRGQS